MTAMPLPGLAVAVAKDVAAVDVGANISVTTVDVGAVEVGDHGHGRRGIAALVPVAKTLPHM